MDPALVSALSAIGGSLVGALTSFAGTRMTQQSQYRRDFINKQIADREMLYSAFISEASRAAVDSLDHNLDKMDQLIPLYTLVGRIRLAASDSVVTASERLMKEILAGYFRANYSAEQVKEMALGETNDPVGEFSRVCRVELQALADGYGFDRTKKSRTGLQQKP